MSFLEDTFNDVGNRYEIVPKCGIYLSGYPLTLQNSGFGNSLISNKEILGLGQEKILGRIAV